MSTTDGLSIPVNLQQDVISASLNGGMIFNFLMGMYTMVYVGTVYLYASKKVANSRIVVSSISVLYFLCLCEFLIDWYYLDLAVVIKGDTRKSIFASTMEGGPAWIFVLERFFFYSVFVVADGLLIWRCYNTWGRSLRVISIPLVFFFAELGLFVAVIAMAALFGAFDPSDAETTLGNNIISAQILVSLGTTVITTFLIGYRVHTASRLSRSSSGKIFTHVVVMVTESAAAYAVVLLVFAIVTVVPSSTNLGSPSSYASDYAQTLVISVGGMAPTILVARIAIANHNNTATPSITHISGLRFDPPLASGQEANHSVNTGYVAEEGEVKETV